MMARRQGCFPPRKDPKEKFHGNQHSTQLLWQDRGDRGSRNRRAETLLATSCSAAGSSCWCTHAIGMNFVRYGAKSFLLIAPPAMGSPNELFPVEYGFPLWTVYAVWVVVLLLLYPACLWFARLKQRRHDWWLTYL
jgi:hypothetical protein